MNVACSSAKPIDRVRRALEFLAPASHRPEKIDMLERAVRVMTETRSTKSGAPAKGQSTKGVVP